MTTAMVIDASVVIAILRGEPLQSWVTERLVDSRICATNYAEVATYIAKLDDPKKELGKLLDGLGFDVVALDRTRAVTAGSLAPRTSALGLSLGDRCCLSLAKMLGLPALTTDRAWMKAMDAVGVEVLLAR